MTHRAVGIYLLGSLGYALMGSSRQLAGGPTSVISLMIAANVGRWRAERPLIRTDRRPFSIRRGAALPDRHKLSSEHSVITEKNMKKFGISLALVALLSSAAYVSTPARAEIGRVASIFTKGGFVEESVAARACPTLPGHHYPFTVSGVSVGFTVGASTTKLVGRALNLRDGFDRRHLQRCRRRRRRCDWWRRRSIAEHGWSHSAIEGPKGRR